MPINHFYIIQLESIYIFNLLPDGGGISIFHPLPVLEQVEFFLISAFNSDPDKFPELGRDTEKLNFHIYI